MRGGLMDDAFTWSLWETFKKRKQSLPKPLETSCQENIWQTCTKECVDIFELLTALSSQLWATFKAQVKCILYDKYSNKKDFLAKKISLGI